MLAMNTRSRLGDQLVHRLDERLHSAHAIGKGGLLSGVEFQLDHPLHAARAEKLRASDYGAYLKQILKERDGS